MTAHRRAWPVTAALTVLSLFAVGLAVLLATSPLWELPDTFCRRVVDPENGICSPIVTRREQWIAWVLAAAVLLWLAAARLRRRWAGAPAARPPAVVLMFAAAAVAIAAAAFLTIGRNHEYCGSTLSRVDEHGYYSPGRPAACAPSYAASRQDAAILGGIAAVLFVLGALPRSISDGRDADSSASPSPG